VCITISVFRNFVLFGVINLEFLLQVKFMEDALGAKLAKLALITLTAKLDSHAEEKHHGPT
jgi:hypothetical protein